MIVDDRLMSGEFMIESPGGFSGKQEVVVNKRHVASVRPLNVFRRRALEHSQIQERFVDELFFLNPNLNPNLNPLSRCKKIFEQTLGDGWER